MFEKMFLVAGPPQGREVTAVTLQFALTSVGGEMLFEMLLTSGGIVAVVAGEFAVQSDVFV